MSSDTTTTYVLMDVSANEGYAPGQVYNHNPLTLGELLRQIRDAVSFYGEDAVLIAHDASQTYGARYGSIDPHSFEEYEDDEDDEDEDDWDENGDEDWSNR